MPRHLVRSRLILLTATFGTFASLGGCYNDPFVHIIRDGGSGGQSAVGGSAATGGSDSATGGESAGVGGATSAGGTGLGGELNTGCTSDAECTDGGPCNLTTGVCMAPEGSGGNDGTGGDEGGGSGGAEGTGGSNGEFVSLITNGDFSSGLDFWGGGDNDLDSEIQGEGCVRWNSLIGWEVAEGVGIDLQAGNYNFSFKMRTIDGDSGSDEKVNVEVKIARASDPYEPIVFLENLENLGNSDQTHSFQFTLDNDAINMGLAFGVALHRDGGDELCIDDVVLEKTN